MFWNLRIGIQNRRTQRHDRFFSSRPQRHPGKKNNRIFKGSPFPLPLFSPCPPTFYQLCFLRVRVVLGFVILAERVIRLTVGIFRNDLKKKKKKSKPSRRDPCLNFSREFKFFFFFFISPRKHKSTWEKRSSTSISGSSLSLVDSISKNISFFFFCLRISSRSRQRSVRKLSDNQSLFI